VERCEIKVRIDPANIFVLDNVIEGYYGLAIVSTGKAKTGEVTVHVTPDTYDDVLSVLKNFPLPISVLEIEPME